VPTWGAQRSQALLAVTPLRGRLPASEPRRKIAEDELEPPPAPLEDEAATRLAAALRALDLDGMTARQALQWLWEQQERLGREDYPPRDGDVAAPE
jgi:hypothetical protein